MPNNIDQIDEIMKKVAPLLSENEPGKSHRLDEEYYQEYIWLIALHFIKTKTKMYWRNICWIERNL